MAASLDELPDEPPPHAETMSVERMATIEGCFSFTENFCFSFIFSFIFGHKSFASGRAGKIDRYEFDHISANKRTY